MRRMVLAALGFFLAGCGSGHRATSNVTTLPRSIVDLSSDPDRLVVSGTATIPQVKVGTEIACKGRVAETRTTVPPIPAPGDEVEESSGGDWSRGGPMMSIQFSYVSNHTLTVACKKK